MTGRDATNSSRRPGDNETIGHKGGSATTDGSFDGMGRIGHDLVPRSDWNKTLDTAVSIPEGPEERADEHEANASLEMGSSNFDETASVKDGR